MIKTLISLSLLFSSSAAWAVAHRTAESARRTQAQTCTNCSVAASKSSATDQIRSVRNTVSSQLSVTDIYSINEKMKFAERCDSFADDEGLGKWGTTIVTFMQADRLQQDSSKRLYSELYEGSADLIALCPAFPKLNDNGKELVWVMIINAMVHLESSCKKAETAQGPNGSLKGLMQLHQGKENKYARGCRRGDANSPDTTFRCSLSMLNRQLANDESLFSRRSYWDVLRPQARSQKYKKVKASIQKLSFCK